MRSPIKKRVNKHVADSTRLAKKFPAKAAMTYGTNLEESLKDAYAQSINKNKWRLENNPNMDLSKYGEKGEKAYIQSLKIGKFDDDIKADFNRVVKRGGNQLRYNEVGVRGNKLTEPMRDFPNNMVTNRQIEKTRDRYFGGDERSGDTPLNHCASDMMHSGGWQEMRKHNSPGTTGNKEAIKHNKKIMSKIGTFNMPHSPLNKGHEVNQDSIAAAKAWKEHKAGYLKKEGGQKEYDMEKGEFYYSPKHKKLRLIPTDDGEVQDRSGIEKWQLAPDRKSSKTPLNQTSEAEKRRYDRAKDESGETQTMYKKTINDAFTQKANPAQISNKLRETYPEIKNNSVEVNWSPDGSEVEVYNMTPNATPEESKAVRDKFDATYMKGRGPFLKSRCWEGYEPTPGVKAYEPGSCRKK